MSTNTAEVRSAEETVAQAVARQYRDAGGYGETLALGVEFSLGSVAPGIDWEESTELDELRETIVDRAETLIETEAEVRRVGTGEVTKALAVLGVKV